MKNIYNIIVSSMKAGIRYKKDDFLILEKILGINTAFMFQKYIVDNLIEPDYDTLEALIDVLMECEGTFSRCVFIKYIGDDIVCQKENNKYYKENEWIKMYTIILREIMPKFRIHYSKVMDLYLERCREQYSYREIKSKIERQRDMIIQMKLGIVKGYEYHGLFMEDINNRLNNRFNELFKSKTEEKEKAMTLWSNLSELEKNTFLEGYVYIKNVKICDLTSKIQSRIIEKSYKKYCDNN